MIRLVDGCLKSVVTNSHIKSVIGMSTLQEKEAEAEHASGAVELGTIS